MDKAVRIEEHLGLVHTCAKRFRGKGIEYDDLYQAGCVGLVKACENFNAALGYRFSTYAVPVILGEIRRLFRDGGAVKLSRSLKELSVKVSREAQAFSLEYGREPAVSELCERLELSAEQVTEALNASRLPVSLTVSDEDGEVQNDIPVPPPDEAVTEHLALHTELQRLSEQDRKLIELRYYRRMTQTKAAGYLGMTQVQVSRREKKILLFLRQQLVS